MSISKLPYGANALKQWDQLQHLLRHEESIEMDGSSLDVPTVVAAARNKSNVHLNESCLPAIEKSAAYFKRCLAEGHSIYGVNTGFGGSADVRTEKTDELQSSLIDFLNCGVIAHTVDGQSHSASTTTIPEAWVRASMLIRANSLARGHSGVRSAVIDGLINFLNNDIVPLIPLRGSISASGDLIPLSYIAGALQGKRSINVWTSIPPKPLRSIRTGVDWIKGQITPPTPTSSDPTADFELIEKRGSPELKAWSNLPKEASIRVYEQSLRHSVASNLALTDYNLTPLKLEPKEGLSLVNGTAVSAGSGALVVFDAQGIALLAQVLTAMSVEALTGTAESFDPFIGQVRPHAGQIEAAHNIRSFLQGSKLARKHESEGVKDHGGLRQDRYSLRTTPQWIGPQLENLSLAHKQVEIECNSTTDNPLLDSDNGRVLHGGNFQALAVTSAMEKIRQSLQQLGRMLFLQCSELINPVFNNGLPPNLEAGEPSQGFLCKGVDVSAASLCSELGYLANPITPHVQTAEMGNQSLNSMAFVSTRYTHTSLDVISQLAAAHLFVVCQALDLRCIKTVFLDSLKTKLEAITCNLLGKHTVNISDLNCRLWSKFQVELAHTTSQDSHERFHNIFKALQSEILSTPDLRETGSLFDSLTQWTTDCASEASHVHKDCLSSHVVDPNSTTTGHLGAASLRIWQFVRLQLKVPFHGGKRGFGNDSLGDEEVSVGEMVTRIYVAIKEGGLIAEVMECVRAAHALLPADEVKPETA